MASASAAAFGGGGLTIQQDGNEGQADLKRLSGCAMFKQLVLCTVCVALMALGCALVCQRVCTASEHSLLQELSRWRSVFRTAPCRGEEVALRGRGGERGEQWDMAKRLHTCSVGRPLARVYHLGLVSMSSGIQKTGPPIMT